jgi:Bifunctional DNA primase/polymerase, N-terminal/Primase C terminal 2 (PriCT-2)
LTVTTLPLAFSGIPTIPVQVWHVDGNWKKRPLVDWDQATIDENQIERWWRKWPQARPGIPLAAVGWCVIDVDDPADEAWLGLQPLRMLGPHSRIKTPSGGLHLVFAQPPEPISKFQWSPGVEILGSSCLLTVHDVDEILFPRVAPRAVLPEVFWKPHVRLDVYPTIKGRPSAHRPSTPPTDIADVDEALFKLDACEWRGRHDEWLALMIACKSEGGSENGFVRWSLSDPRYAGDERIIRRKWCSIEPGHGGALFKSLAEHGIRLRPHSKAKPFLIGGAHISAKAGLSAKAGKPPANLQSRSSGLMNWLSKNLSGDGVFSAACLLAELNVTQATVTKLILGNFPSLRKSLGEAEVCYQIARAFDHINAKRTETA